MVVSIDFPFWIAAAEAPDPRCSEINDVSSTGYRIELQTQRTCCGSVRTSTEDGEKAYFLEEFRGLPQDERIANPVKPVLPDHLLLRHLRIEWIGVDMRGYTSRMERRIKVRDIDGLG